MSSAITPMAKNSLHVVSNLVQQNVYKHQLFIYQKYWSKRTTEGKRQIITDVTHQTSEDRHVKK